MSKHCHYCNAALYKMSYKPGSLLVVQEPDKEEYHNSSNERICKKCDESLIRRDTKIECHCGNHIYYFVSDMFNPGRLSVDHIKGVNPQPDPIEGIKHKCVHCRRVIQWRE